MEDKVFVRDGKKAMFIQIGSILVLESEGNYSKIMSLEGHVLIRKPIKYFENRLNPADFFRVNRAQMINLRRVRTWEALPLGRMRAVLENGTSVEISRRQNRLLREKMKL